MSTTPKPPRPDFDAIKASADLAKVIASYGIELKKQGADLVGLCPFHEDTKPSLHITPAKQLWHCPACGAGGNVIQFVAKREGVSEKEAALQLLARLPGVTRGSEIETTATSNNTAPVACDPLKHSELFTAIITHYHEILLGSGKSGKTGLDYLKKRGLGSIEMLAHFKLGYVDGSLKKKLSPAQLAAARECGLINERGNEKFYQRIVVPIFDEQNRPVGLYGRDTTNSSNVAHLYLAGPHRAVWNSGAAHVYPDNLIVTEAILDALALWIAGNQNVIACYGAGGWTPHHTALIESASTRRVTFAFDADAAGEARARQHAQALVAQGIACHLLEWPQGVHDANGYFLYESQTGFRGTAESFAALLVKAPRFAHHRDPSENPSSPSRSSSSENAPRLTLSERSDEATVFQNGHLSYRVKGLGTSGNLRIILTAASETARHVDQIDLYTARARRSFATACGERLSLDPAKIEADLLALVEALETLQQQEKSTTTTHLVIAPMSEAEQAAARAWLQRENLLDHIAADLDLIGYVGEPRNKKLAYLIATSRLLPKPLSGIFRAQSGCGKSFLMECAAELMPPEEVHYFSRLTPQALYYLEADALKHKLLIVDERDGSEESEYPIRTLQTRRILKLAVPLKDPNSGKIKTTVLEIHGPIAYMESTTGAHINPENANRCFELYLDESAAQTRAIFAAQRNSRTLAGWENERRKAAILQHHHHAQRLLRPLKVIIPYVHHIEFPAAWLRGRRDNDRFLSLIEGIAFLHQHQRKIGSENATEYIESNIQDYAIAHDLAHQVFAQAGSDIPKPVADFLATLETAMRQAAADVKQDPTGYTFSRRQVREALQLPDYLVKLYMRQIEELELIEVQRAARGSSFRYRLAATRDLHATLHGLTPPDELAKKWKSGSEVEVASKSTQTHTPQAIEQSGGSGTGTLERKKIRPSTS